MRIALQLLACVAVAAISTVGACTPDLPFPILYALAAGCLTTNSASELLLVQDLDGQWTFPAGNRARLIEGNGAIAERETFEEAGVDVNAQGQACGQRSIAFFDIDIFVGLCCDLVEEPTDPLETNSPSEIQQVAFLSRETIEGLADSELRFPEQRQLLLDVIDGNLCS